MKLRTRWMELCGRVGVDGRRQWDSIEMAYREPGRAYHNLGHIEDCLERFDQMRQLSREPDQVEFAIWFHDLVYDTRRSDNEERSADLAFGFLVGTGLADGVADLVRATKHDGVCERADAALLADIDLSILGADPDRYRSYADGIRKEYGWVASGDYASGRAEVLSGFLAREFIYGLREFRQIFEASARLNIGGELARLG